MEPDPDATKLPDGDADATRLPPGPDPDATRLPDGHLGTTKLAASEPDATPRPPGATLPSPEAASGGLATGRLVFGRYTLAAEAGRGGMGVVWRARDEKLDRTVALKFLPEAVAADAEALRDLRRETRRCLDLTHPNIVRVYDLVEDGPLVAIAMEFIEGKSLSVRKTATPAGCLGTDELAPFVTQLCAALDYAHTQAKVVHRDLKPANLLVTRDGQLKVADFGIARSLSETHTRLTGKAGGGISGTLQYMSPQQLAGEKPTAGDDIYALGATLYELLAGKPPFFRGDAHSLMKQIADTAPQSPTKRRLELELKGPPIPRVWEQSILACLAKDPAQRPRNAGEVAARLGLAHSMATAAPQKKSRVPLLAGLAAAVAVAAAVVVFWPQDKTSPAPRPASLGAASISDTPTPALPTPTPVPNPTLAGPSVDNPVETTRKLVEAEVARQLALANEKPPQTPTTNNAISPTRSNALPQNQAQQWPTFAPLMNGATPSMGGAFTLSDLALRMIWIAPGTFTMGSPPDEVGRSTNETQHEVTLTQGCWLGATEVTQAQWTAVMGGNPSHFKGGTLPVEQVSWDHALMFCQTLTDRERVAGRLPAGYAYTLPTEAQWEYACRAGTTLPSAGDLSSTGWHGPNSGGATHPVGTKPPNTWGFFDMLGNVQNWCYDIYQPYQDSAVTDPIVLDGRSFARRVVRGGIWSGSPVLSRAARRTPGPISGSYSYGIGFRPALRTIGALENGKAESIMRTEVSKPVGVSAERALPTFALLAGAAGPVPGQGGNYSLPNLGVGMIWVAPGTFNMGSPALEAGRQPGETQHQVTLTQGYWLGQTDVTQAQWTAVMGNNPSCFKGDRLPVEQVSWTDAMAFCLALTDRERTAGRLPAGYTYTLPTEAQWEYACRAGTTGAYADNLDAMAWYYRNSGGTTHPVGQMQMNQWGFFDMNGNVWQWCLDRFGPYPNAAVTDPSGPVSGPDTPQRNERGGGWFDDAGGCRSAIRHDNVLNFRDGNLGFRLALSRSAVPAGPVPKLPSFPTPASGVSPNLGGSFMVPNLDLGMIWIAPGTFMMGSPAGEAGHQSNETQHQVTLTHGYWLGATDVTQAQWTAVMGSSPSTFKGDSLPVETVSWDDAMAFCQKLTGREQDAGRLPAGYAYTLPTEAQWEYACRAGADGPNLVDPDAMAWSMANSGGVTHPVGTKQPNARGFFDMYGEVWQWCLDWYADYPDGGATDPVGPEAGSLRVSRGESFSTIVFGSANRSRMAPGIRNNSHGFRLALAPSLPK